jgi:glycosyltransferase involved in cell wall biosynthesis
MLHSAQRVRVRIAFFSPLSPIRSAIADFSEGLAVAMARNGNVSIDFFIDDGYEPDDPAIRARFRIRSFREFEAAASTYDVVVYAMGDHNAYHGYMLDFIRTHPGIVILHDLTLHRCILFEADDTGRPERYREELRYAYGTDDLGLAPRVRAGAAGTELLQYPLYERLVDRSLGVVVHNRAALHAVSSRCPEAQVRCIPSPFFLPAGLATLQGEEFRKRERASLGINDDFVVGSFGILVRDKHVEDCLRAFARLLQKSPRARYLLCGPVLEGCAAPAEIAALGLGTRLVVTGWLPPAAFTTRMLAVDVAVHLRHPHIGGTPFTPIRMMGLGVCTILSDIEPLADIPDDACVKVPADDRQMEVLAERLEFLAAHPLARQAIADRGRRWIGETHGEDDVARRYLEFFREVTQPAVTPR